jgi:hypothetical protein
MNRREQLSLTFGEQPELQNKDLDYRYPQDHSKTGKRLQRLPGRNTKHGDQNRN